MELSGQVTIAASSEAIWNALFDPATLQACIPGCKTVERREDGSYAATMGLKIGPLSATFNAVITLEDPNYPVSVRLSGSMQGAGAGFTKGHAGVRLEQIAEGTELRYNGDVKVGGKLAAVGDRVFGAAVRKNIVSFFDALAVQLQPASAEEGADAPSVRNAG